MSKLNKKSKVKYGQYYTVYNPFINQPFIDWINRVMEETDIILEPFAGANNIPSLIKQDVKFKSYDIEPGAKGVIKRNTIKNYPKNFVAAITNPPYLAKNRAKRMGIKFQYEDFDDLYKKCLDTMLKNNRYVAAIIPSSFINSSFPKDRLYAYVELNKTMFDDTEVPVCLALFVPEKVNDTLIYRNEIRIGSLNLINNNINLLLENRNNIKMSFNDPKGNIGLRAIDNTKRGSIEFVDPTTLKNYNITNSSRHITIIKTNSNISIQALNDVLNKLRNISSDISLTTFKGLRSDSMYRRRLDFKTARKIINSVELI